MEPNQDIFNRDTKISLSEIIKFEFKPKISNIQSNEENFEEDKKRYYITPIEKAEMISDFSVDIDKSKKCEIALQNINSNNFNSSTKFTKTLNFNNIIQISDSKERTKKIFKVICPTKKRKGSKKNIKGQKLWIFIILRQKI